MTVETHVPIAELAHHGAAPPVINALRRCDLLFVHELGAALACHDAAVEGGLSSKQYLGYTLPGIGPKLLAQARVAYDAWAARPCDLTNARMGPCEGQVEPYFPTFGYGGEKMAFYCRRHGQIIEDS